MTLCDVIVKFKISTCSQKKYIGISIRGKNSKIMSGTNFQLGLGLVNFVGMNYFYLYLHFCLHKRISLFTFLKLKSNAFKMEFTRIIPSTGQNVTDPTLNF